VTDLGGGVYLSRIDSDEFELDEEDGGFAHTLSKGRRRHGRPVGAGPDAESLTRRERGAVCLKSAGSREPPHEIRSAR